MATRLNPLVIRRRSDGKYYSRSNVIGKRGAIAPDGVTPIIVPVCEPHFGANSDLYATQFHTRADAEAHIANPDLGSPEQWADCEIVHTFDA